MNHRLPLFVDRLDTPIGEMLIVTDLEGYLRAVDWADYEMRMNRLLHLHYGTNGFSIDSTRAPNGVTDAISKYFLHETRCVTVLSRYGHLAHRTREAVILVLRVTACG
jgi:methylated-DNA-[protein]-cysteine S-methyltransferase